MALTDDRPSGRPRAVRTAEEGEPGSPFDRQPPQDLTAALLKWQAPRLDSREIIAAVVSLHSVETRHAAWIRHIVGLRPATTAFDKPASQHKMAQLIDSTHFLVSQPKTKGRGKPGFTG